MHPVIYINQTSLTISVTFCGEEPSNPSNIQSYPLKGGGDYRNFGRQAWARYARTIIA